MSIDLRNFLAEAGQNPSLVEELRRDPSGTGGRLGLAPNEVSVLLSGSQRQVEEALGFNGWDLPVFFRPPVIE